MRSPHTMGLECDNPGTSSFQATLRPFSRSHEVGVDARSTTPSAPGPRNEGQFWAYAVTAHNASRALHPAIGSFLPASLGDDLFHVAQHGRSVIRNPVLYRPFDAAAVH